MPAPEPAVPYEVTASGAEADGGWVIAVRIPAGTPLCDGHFPGHPIVPGVAQLALVERALADWRGGAVGLGGIPSLRLRLPVVPGEELAVRVRAGGKAGTVGFEVRRGGAIVANGSVAEAEAAGGGDLRHAPRREEARGDAAFPAIEELVPHRGAMLLVQDIVAADPASLTARAAVSPANPLTVEGLAPSWLALEAAAQAAALHEALARAGDSGPRSEPKIGYLVSVRDAALGSPFPAGAPLLVAVRGAGGAGGLATYEVEVALEADGRQVARGRLGTFTLAEVVSV